jgi:hypothetical protein
MAVWCSFVYISECFRLQFDFQQCAIVWFGLQFTSFAEISWLQDRAQVKFACWEQPNCLALGLRNLCCLTGSKTFPDGADVSTL